MKIAETARTALQYLPGPLGRERFWTRTVPIAILLGAAALGAKSQIAETDSPPFCGVGVVASRGGNPEQVILDAARDAGVQDPLQNVGPAATRVLDLSEEMTGERLVYGGYAFGACIENGVVDPGSVVSTPHPLLAE